MLAEGACAKAADARVQSPAAAAGACTRASKHAAMRATHTHSRWWKQPATRPPCTSQPRSAGAGRTSLKDRPHESLPCGPASRLKASLASPACLNTRCTLRSREGSPSTPSGAGAPAAATACRSCCSDTPAAGMECTSSFRSSSGGTRWLGGSRGGVGADSCSSCCTSCAGGTRRAAAGWAEGRLQHGQNGRSSRAIGVGATGVGQARPDCRGVMSLLQLLPGTVIRNGLLASAPWVAPCYHMHTCRALRSTVCRARSSLPDRHPPPAPRPQPAQACSPPPHHPLPPAPAPPRPLLPTLAPPPRPPGLRTLTAAEASSSESWRPCPPSPRMSSPSTCLARSFSPGAQSGMPLQVALRHRAHKRHKRHHSVVARRGGARRGQAGVQTLVPAPPAQPTALSTPRAAGAHPRAQAARMAPRPPERKDEAGVYDGLMVDAQRPQVVVQRVSDQHDGPVGAVGAAGLGMLPDELAHVRAGLLSRQGHGLYFLFCDACHCTRSDNTWRGGLGGRADGAAPVRREGAGWAADGMAPWRVHMWALPAGGILRGLPGACAAVCERQQAAGRCHAMRASCNMQQAVPGAHPAPSVMRPAHPPVSCVRKSLMVPGGRTSLRYSSLPDSSTRHTPSSASSSSSVAHISQSRPSSCGCAPLFSRCRLVRFQPGR